MNKYTAKTLDDALEQAANDMQVAKERGHLYSRL